MSLLQVAKLCNNDFIISYYYIGWFYYNSIITHYYHITYSSYYVFESE